ncbi:MAG: hypothetical protein ACOC2W_04720 [bacterium]
MGKNKLKLEVNIYNEKNRSAEIISDVYCVSFIFLEIDEKISENSYMSFTAKNKFIIKYSNNIPYGLLSYNCLNIPRKDKLGFELKRYFRKEEDRYVYLRKIYEALKDWSTSMYNLDGQIFINRTRFNFNNNIWLIEKRDMPPLRIDDDIYNHQRYHNVFM